MRVNTLWLMAAVFILAIVAAFSFKIGRLTAPDTGIPTETLQLAQDSLKATQAELRVTGELIASLRRAGSAGASQLKVAATTIADLEAKLAKVTGGGAGTAELGGWSSYQDKYLTANFRQGPDSLKYTLSERPIAVELIEGKAGAWYCYGWDMLANAPAAIDNFKVQQDKSYTPPKPWYKEVRLGFSGGYAAGGVLAGPALGYKKVLAQPIVHGGKEVSYGGILTWFMF